MDIDYKSAHQLKETVIKHILSVITPKIMEIFAIMYTDVEEYTSRSNYILFKPVESNFVKFLEEIEIWDRFEGNNRYLDTVFQNFAEKLDKVSIAVNKVLTYEIVSLLSIYCKVPKFQSINLKNLLPSVNTVMASLFKNVAYALRSKKQLFTNKAPKFLKSYSNLIEVAFRRAIDSNISLTDVWALCAEIDKTPVKVSPPPVPVPMTHEAQIRRQMFDVNGEISEIGPAVANNTDVMKIVTPSEIAVDDGSGEPLLENYRF